MKNNQETLNQEIDDAEITAADFTIELRGLPYLGNKNVQEYRAELQRWIEELLYNSTTPETRMYCPDTELVDENQNKLVNLTFALSDYGKMSHLMKIAEVFKEEKKMVRKLQYTPDQVIIAEE